MFLLFLKIRDHGERFGFNPAFTRVLGGPRIFIHVCLVLNDMILRIRPFRLRVVVIQVIAFSSFVRAQEHAFFGFRALDTLSHDPLLLIKIFSVLDFLDLLYLVKL